VVPFDMKIVERTVEGLDDNSEIVFEVNCKLDCEVDGNIEDRLDEKGKVVI